MSNDTHTPTFSEGSTVRDRETGLEYTATGETIPGNGQLVYWAIVTGADGVERQLPVCDLEPVDGRISNPTPSAAHVSNATIPAGFTLTSDDGEFLDAKGPTYTESDCIIESVWSSDKGHQFFLERRMDEPFTLDELSRLADLLKIIQLRHTSTADLEAEARRRGLGDAL